MFKPTLPLYLVVLTIVFLNIHGVAQAAGGPTGAPSSVDQKKNILVVTPKNSKPITFSNIGSAAANSICVALGGGEVNKNSSSCIYNNQPLTNPGLSYKSNDKLKFIAPKENANQTISIDQSFSFIIQNTRLTRKTKVPVGKYRIFASYYAPDQYDTPTRIYEANITKASRLPGKRIALESDLTTNDSSEKFVPGNYSFLVIDTKTGEGKNVSALTFLR